MTRNIDQWRGLQGIWSFRRETVLKFLDGLDFDYLCQRAAQAIRRQVPSGTVKVITDRFTSGRERVVFEVEFSDGTLWVARISLPPLPVAADDCSLLPCPGPEVMLSEIVTMRYVGTETSIPLPRIHGHELGNRNQLGAPYMLMDRVLGKFIRPLPSTPNDEVPHIYGQVADIVLALSRLTFPKIGLISSGSDISKGLPAVSQCLFHDLSLRNAFTTSSEYYTTRFQDFLDEKKKQIPLDDNWVAFAWLCLQSIPHFLIPELENGPFPLHHPDLNNGNILYNNNHEIVGVLDWTATGTFPWEIAMAPPEALDSEYFPERRKMYIDIFEVKEIAMTGSNRFSSFTRSPASEIVNLVNDNYGSWGKRFPDERAVRLARLMYGSETIWEDVKTEYRKREPASR
jgi:isoamyl acetate esterase